MQKESFAHDVIAFVLSQGIRTVCLFFLVEFAECVAKSKVPQQTDTTTPLCDMSWASNMNTDEKLRFMNILSDHAGSLHISRIYRIQSIICICIVYNMCNCIIFGGGSMKCFASSIQALSSSTMNSHEFITVRSLF